MLKPTKEHYNLANEIYLDFCEDHLGDHPFQQAWDEYEVNICPIEVGSHADKLVLESIAFGVQQASPEKPAQAKFTKTVENVPLPAEVIAAVKAYQKGLLSLEDLGMELRGNEL